MLYVPKLVEVPEEFRDALRKAHDELAEFAAGINQMHSAAENLLASIPDLEAKLKSARDDYARSISAEAGGAGAADIRACIRELEQQIAEAKSTASDLSGRAFGQKSRFAELQRAKSAARRKIVNRLRAPFPAGGVEPMNRKPLDMDESISIAEFMVVYLAAHDGPAGAHPFGAADREPRRFFQLMRQFFRQPNQGEYHALLDWFENVIWGEDGVPSEVTIPQPPAKYSHALQT